MTERTYKDIDGNDQTLHSMIRKEPEWTASRFRHMEDKIEVLENALRTLFTATRRSKDVDLINARQQAREATSHLSSTKDI